MNFFYALSALTLAFVGTACHFVEFASTEAMTNIETGESESIALHFGYWYYQSWGNSTNSTSIGQDNCSLYPQTISLDDTMKTGRAFNLIAIIIGGSLVMIDVFNGCLSTKRNKSFKTGAIGYLVCCISSGLSLLILSSNVCKNNALIKELNELLPVAQFAETCSISKGAKSTIAATVLWFVAAVGAIVLHPLHTKSKNETTRVVDDGGLDEPLFADDESVSSNII